MQKGKTPKGNKGLLSVKEGAKERGLRVVKGKNDAQKICTGIKIGCAKDVYEAMRFLENEDREKFYILCLNVKRQVICTELISIGTLTQSLIHPREVFKAAIKNSSASIICVHNHPSGEPEPSTDDINITKKLEKAGEIIGIKVLDHIIIGKDDFSSQIYKASVVDIFYGEQNELLGELGLVSCNLDKIKLGKFTPKEAIPEEIKIFIKKLDMVIDKNEKFKEKFFKIKFARGESKEKFIKIKDGIKYIITEAEKLKAELLVFLH